MENHLGKTDGERLYEKIKENIPAPYCNYVKDIQYAPRGHVYEKILMQILKTVLQDSEIKNKVDLLYQVKRGNKDGGYLKPDLQVNDNVFIEVTTWGDSNMIFSKIFQGYLLKKKRPKARYYVVIADLDISDGWTWNSKQDKELREEWSKIGDVIAVDGWFGFKNIDQLVDRIKST